MIKKKKKKIERKKKEWYNRLLTTNNLCSQTIGGEGNAHCQSHKMLSQKIMNMTIINNNSGI